MNNMNYHYSILIRSINGTFAVEPFQEAHKMQKRYDELMRYKKLNCPIISEYRDKADEDGKIRRRMNRVTFFPEHIATIACRIDDTDVAE